MLVYIKFPKVEQQGSFSGPTASGSLNPFQRSASDALTFGGQAIPALLLAIHHLSAGVIRIVDRVPMPQ
jgi:hypothetical protein